MDLRRLSRLLEGYRTLRSQGEARLRRAVPFLQGLAPLLVREREALRAEAPGFNVFRALGVDWSEVPHSAFLAYMLDPQADHAQGTEPLRALLERLARRRTKGGRALPDLDLHQARVVVEHPTGVVEVQHDGKTIQHLGFIDVCVLFPGFALAIENKVKAGEQFKQLERYREALVRSRFPACAVVFLTPAGRRPETGEADYLFSYGGLASWALSLAAGSPPKVASSLEQYADVCRQIWEWKQ